MLNVFSHSNILEKDKSFANTLWDYRSTKAPKLTNKNEENKHDKNGLCVNREENFSPL